MNLNLKLKILQIKLTDTSRLHFNLIVPFKTLTPVLICMLEPKCFPLALTKSLGEVELDRLYSTVKQKVSLVLRFLRPQKPFKMLLFIHSPFDWRCDFEIPMISRAGEFIFVTWYRSKRFVKLLLI